MNIDWSKAPNGFDFCLIGKSRSGHAKFYIGEADRYVSQSGSFVAYVDAGEFDIFHRPAERWDGNGYPSIGTFCEYQCEEDGIWRGCEIVARRNGAWVILDNEYDTDFVTLESLRPIRTQEQIAAEEREREADLAISTLNLRQFCPGSIAVQNAVRHVVGEMIRAGYRKAKNTEDQP